MRRGDLVGVIEAAYAIDRDDQVWLAGIHDAVAPCIEAGLGSCAFRYDASRLPVRVHETVLQDSPLDVAAIKAVVGGMSKGYVDRSWRTMRACMATEVPSDDEPAVAQVAQVGVEDVLVINAFDPSGAGVYIGAFRSTRGKLAKHQRAAYDHIAAHLATALRLRERVARATSEVVLTPRGRVVHAEGQGKLAAARDALATATRAIDRARGAMRRRDPEGAIVSWRALVSARWSLVDRFERDGTRYVVAKINEPSAPTLAALAPRERQVLAYAALGHHAKLIAYELGIAPSTVRVLLVRAGRKLGTKTSRATIAKFIELARQH